MRWKRWNDLCGKYLGGCTTNWRVWSEIVRGEEWRSAGIGRIGGFVCQLVRSIGLGIRAVDYDVHNHEQSCCR